MSGTFWTIEQVEPIIKERNELRQRVKELEKATKDAERYQWLLRYTKIDSFLDQVQIRFSSEDYCISASEKIDLSAAIDAAMEADK